MFVAREQPDAWLIPCGVTGTPAFSWTWRRVFDRTPVLLTYGRPFRVRWPAVRADRAVLAEITREVMAQLAAVLPAEVQGAYPPVNPAQCRWLELISDDSDGA